MAEAVGQLTGKPAAVLGTRAVGAGNMSIGIHTARQNSTPIVALVGQVKREFLGREAFQEVDQVESFGRLAKWAAQIDDPATAGEIVVERAASAWPEDGRDQSCSPCPKTCWTCRRRAAPSRRRST